MRGLCDEPQPRITGLFPGIDFPGAAALETLVEITFQNHHRRR